jgi:uncharacterized membrane protein
MNETRNPYAPPAAPVADPSGPAYEAGALIENGRQVPVGHCTLWIKGTFELFFQAPWKWIGVVLLFAVPWLASTLVPFSILATTLLYPVVLGGVACALDSQRRTRSFALSDVFAGFGPRFASLAGIGCVAILSTIMNFAVLNAMLGPEAALAFAFNAAKVETLPPNFVSAMLVCTVASLPITAATFCAAPLVTLHGAGAVRAMKMSFFGCLKNIVPWILYGLLMFLIIAASAVPLLLGLFVTIPAALIAFYPIYRDVFVADEVG